MVNYIEICNIFLALGYTTKVDEEGYINVFDDDEWMFAAEPRVNEQGKTVVWLEDFTSFSGDVLTVTELKDYLAQ